MAGCISDVPRRVVAPVLVVPLLPSGRLRLALVLERLPSGHLHPLRFARAVVAVLPLVLVPVALHLLRLLARGALLVLEELLPVALAAPVLLPVRLAGLVLLPSPVVQILLAAFRCVLACGGLCAPLVASALQQRGIPAR